ncbi:ATP-binding protein [Mesorhizobium sp. NZP2077]|uniref:ATP-binding protein n=1 Tax=Mesorhizobium sp. NZP2077 TaxID=2483404 RepID=UPI001555D2C9|nr:ATP-binding protein [Mesorhizobium sp. NZP2077]QKD20637.1 hypothetical protein HGP13_37590 [Mesorhizobium sp. NZP2077]
MTSVSVGVEPYFGAFILETLTVGMYGESRNAIREYVQNGFDSIQRAVEDLDILPAGAGKVTVSFHDNFVGLTIRDNGAGLSVDIAASTLASIGASRKDYRTDAGFRGIGRLAGIVFANTLTFRTKATGEPKQTTVTFKAAKMRELMSPAMGSTLTADALLRQCVTVEIEDVDKTLPSFFEVVLDGFTSPPEECLKSDLMARFLSQVAPVPFAPDFPFVAQILDHAAEGGIGIPQVNVILEEPGEEPKLIYKPYGKTYSVEGGADLTPLVKVTPFFSSSKTWWAWVGFKDVPGSYLEAEYRGLRVRAKNIQIDGTDVVRQIFQQRAKSNARYQDWFVGEIYVDLKAVIPNARRDGFEETKSWQDMQKEIANSVCKDLGSAAQEISNEAQLTLQKLTEKAEGYFESYESLKAASFKNKDKVITLSAEITKIQGQIARASRNADTPTLASFRHLGSRLADAKTEAISQLAEPAPVFDVEQREQEIQERVLEELMVVFAERLATPCLNSVRALVKDVFDWSPS